MKMLLGVIVIVAIIQSLMIFTIYDANEKLNEKIINLESSLEEEIKLSKIEFQGHVEELTNNIVEIASKQTDLKEDLSKVQARTSADFSGVIEDTIKGIVSIKTDIGQGTGFIISGDGFIVTNSHVLDGARIARAITYDDEVYNLKLAGYDWEMDIAVLKAEGNFDELKLGDSDDINLGEKVVAIGNPLGLSFTATEGIISGKNRAGINDLPYYLQTDVSLNPGNSGGPLINTEGEVIGINNFKIIAAENIGFALEINRAKDVINRLAMPFVNGTIV